MHDSPRPLGRVDNVACRQIQNGMVVSFHANSNAAAGHVSPLDPTRCVSTLLPISDESELGSEKW